MTELPTVLTKSNLTPSSKDPKQWRSEHATNTDKINNIISYLTGLLGTDGTIASALTFLGVGKKIQDQVWLYFAESGTAAALVITPVPPIAAYAEGQKFCLKASNDCDDNATININGNGDIDIIKPDGSNIDADQIIEDQIVEGVIVWDGVDYKFQLLLTIAPAAPRFQFTDVYTSIYQPIVSGGLVNFNHGLNFQPVLWVIRLLCITAEHGYVVGDHLPMNPANNSDHGSSGGIALWFQGSSTISVRFSSSSKVFVALHKTTGARVQLTNANFTFQLLVFK